MFSHKHFLLIVSVASAKWHQLQRLYEVECHAIASHRLAKCLQWRGVLGRMASGKLCASLDVHIHTNRIIFFCPFSLRHIRESVFAIPKFKSFRFIQDKWNTQFVRRYWRALTRSYVTKMNITFRRVKRCRAIANVDCPSVRSSSEPLQFSVGSYRRMNENCQAK